MVRVPVKFKLTFAPLVMLIAPLPRAAAELHCKVPAEIELAPVKVLVPERTKVPLPVLLIPPAPLMAS